MDLVTDYSSGDPSIRLADELSLALGVTSESLGNFRQLAWTKVQTQPATALHSNSRAAYRAPLGTQCGSSSAILLHSLFPSSVLIPRDAGCAGFGAGVSRPGRSNACGMGAMIADSSYPLESTTLWRPQVGGRPQSELSSLGNTSAFPSRAGLDPALLSKTWSGKRMELTLGCSGRVLQTTRFVLYALLGSTLLGCNSEDDRIVIPPQPDRSLSQNPSWSPDGNTIAFYRPGREFNDVSGVWLIDSNGENPRFAVVGDTPAWSPDGRELALTYQVQIVVWTIAENRIRRLTHAGRNFFPTWSPDGTQIAFDRTEPSDSAGIWVVPSSGQGPAVLITPNAMRARWPSWSPDGGWIAFAAHDGSGWPNLYVMRTDGTDIRRITNAPKGEYFPKWSPDGTAIVYTAEVEVGLRVLELSTGRDAELVGTRHGNLDEYQTAAWSPDGQRLVYNREYLWVINRDGSNNRLLERQVDDPVVR